MRQTEVTHEIATDAALVTGPELAERLGEPYSTIDYWSKLRLLEFERRGNRRMYDARMAQARRELIRSRQREGLNLIAILRELATLGRSSDPGPDLGQDHGAADRLAQLEAKFDAMVVSMQEAPFRRAAEALFSASPAELQEAAARGRSSSSS